ncbi:MAG: hypothetical protein ABR536_02295 [Solirubrobacterales bacterium]
MTEPAQRTALIAFGVLNLAIGLVMLLEPGYFFDHIGEYGIRNDHYLGDTGSFYVAGGIGLLIAARRSAWRLPVCVVAAIWYAIHAINHLFDIGQATSNGRGWSDTILIGLGAAALAYLAKVASDERAGSADRPSPTSRRPSDYPPGD